MSVNNLTVDHQNQIVKFIKFFRSKRELALEQIQADFDDTKNDSLVEDMYTLEEVKSGYDSICHVVKDTTRDEVGSIINMTVLLLGQLFDQADEEEVTLEMDTALVEDQRLLEEVEKMTLDKREDTNKKGMRLKDTMIQMKKDLMKCESDKELAQGKLASVEKKYKKEKKNTEELNRKLADLENALANAGRQSASSSSGNGENSKEDDSETKEDDTARLITSLVAMDMKKDATSGKATSSKSGKKGSSGEVRGADFYGFDDSDDEESKNSTPLEDMNQSELVDKMKKAKAFVNQLRQELECRLADSKQFQQLRKMLREKNVLVEELRRQLNASDGVEIEDDED